MKNTTLDGFLEWVIQNVHPDEARRIIGLAHIYRPGAFIKALDDKEEFEIDLNEGGEDE